MVGTSNKSVPEMAIDVMGYTPQLFACWFLHPINLFDASTYL